MHILNEIDAVQNFIVNILAEFRIKLENSSPKHFCPFKLFHFIIFSSSYRIYAKCCIHPALLFKLINF